METASSERPLMAAIRGWVLPQAQTFQVRDARSRLLKRMRGVPVLTRFVHTISPSSPSPTGSPVSGLMHSARRWSAQACIF